MICPKCESHYVTGATFCPDCNTELIPNAEYEGNLIHPKDWVIIYTTDVQYEAQMFKANLEGANIEVLVLGQNDTNFPVPGDFSIIKILVKDSDANEAFAIIEDINSHTDKTDDD